VPPFPWLAWIPGTWQSDKGAVANAVYHALKSGYRHIDAALCYQNENEVGEGLKKAFDEGICKREDVFVTTKLWNTYHRCVERGLDESLKSLGLAYVDLYLMHVRYVIPDPPIRSALTQASGPWQ
jgi:glycerol 2-dehydrogenase (NADP+)